MSLIELVMDAVFLLLPCFSSVLFSSLLLSSPLFSSLFFSLFQTAHGCDPNGWETLEDGSGMSLLHRAIELQDHPTACFLIESGADVNSCTQPSDASKEPASAPLHMACQRGLKEIVTSLVNHHANVNSKVG